MRSYNCFFSARTLAAGLVGVGLCAQGAPDKAVRPGQEMKVPAAAVEAEIPLSVFVIPASAKEGRNPFFPRSLSTLPAAPKPKEEVVDYTSAIVLNGVTSRPKPTVMINGVTFEKGEEHDLKLAAGGKVKVRCEEIREESALILVNGVQRRELRMRAGLLSP